MSQKIKEHTFWCPDYPDCCSNEHDINNCEGEILRRYVQSFDDKYNESYGSELSGEASGELSSESSGDLSGNNSNDEMSDNQIKDYIKRIVQSNKIGGGCSNNQCGGGRQSNTQNNVDISKWKIPSTKK
jgi:hypothetical protein